eukprot:scaffold35481_cov112-Isochrysis_galbana.AAC.1
MRRRSVKGSGRVRLSLCLKRFAQVQGRVAYGARWAAGVGRTPDCSLVPERCGCLAGPAIEPPFGV